MRVEYRRDGTVRQVEHFSSLDARTYFGPHEGKVASFVRGIEPTEGQGVHGVDGCHLSGLRNESI
jgi:hypothetical protein